MATPHEATPPLVADLSSEYEPDETRASQLRMEEHYKSLKKFEEFADAVYKSLEELLANRRFGLYNSVHVLLLAWGPPEIELLKQLGEVFENKLNFTTECYTITRNDLEEALTLKLEAAVRDHAGADELLIIYYTGHGRLDKDENTTTWQPNRDSPAPEDWILRPLNWSKSEDRLNQSIAKDGNILYIVDSCHEPRKYPLDAGYPSAITGGSKELLGMSHAGDDYGFTRDLIDELQAHFSRPGSISVSTLHSRMIKRQAKRETPEPYRLPLSINARSSSIVLASMTENEPRAPTRLQAKPESVTLCMIQVEHSFGETGGTPRYWWEEYFDGDKTAEREGVKAHPVDYMQFLWNHLFRRHYMVVLMPSKLSHQIAKKLEYQAFAELVSYPSRAELTDEIWNKTMRKAGFHKLHRG